MFEDARVDARARTLLAATATPGAAAAGLDAGTVISHTPVALCDARGHLVWASAAGTAVLGIAPGLCSLLDVVVTEDRDRVAQELDRLAATTGARRRTEFALERVDRSQIYVEADVCSIADGL